MPIYSVPSKELKNFIKEAKEDGNSIYETNQQGSDSITVPTDKGTAFIQEEGITWYRENEKGIESTGEPQPIASTFWEDLVGTCKKYIS